MEAKPLNSQSYENMGYNYKLLPCHLARLDDVMIDFRLAVFRTVAECRNITQAARKLHLSQPAVTKHIQRSEEELQVPLFLRSATGMILTPAGVVFLEHVQQVAA